MAKNNNKIILLWICIAILLTFIIVMFVMINKLDSNNLKKEIDKVEAKSADEQIQLKKQIQSIDDNLNDLKNKLNSISITQTKGDSALSNQIEKFQKQITEVENKVNNLQSKGSNTNSKFSLGWLVLLQIVLLSIIVSFTTSYLFFKIRKKKGKKQESEDGLDNLSREEFKNTIINEVFDNNGRMKQTLNDYYSSNKNTASFQKGNYTNEGNRTITKTEEKTNNVSQKNLQVLNEKSKESSKITNENILYFRSKSVKTLIDELNCDDGAAFKVSDIKESEANFEYCGNVVNADFFTGICSFDNNPDTIPYKTKITTIEKGIVRKENNKWEVTTPAKIRFE